MLLQDSNEVIMYVTALYKLKSILKNKADVQRDIDNILCVRLPLPVAV